MAYSQSGERRQSLILKFDLGNAVGLAMDGGFATLHVDGLFWLGCWIGVHNPTKPETVFLWPKTIFLLQFRCVLDLTFGEVQR